MKSIVNNLMVYDSLYNSSFYIDDYLISYYRSYTDYIDTNTIDFVKKVIEKDIIDYMELDCRLTKDNRILISHDNDLIINGKHVKITDTNYYELTRNSNLVSLDRVVARKIPKIITLNIRFDNNCEQFCEELNKVLSEQDHKLFIIQSSDIVGLRYIKEHSDFECQLVIDDKSKLDYINEFNRVSINRHLFDERVYNELLQSKRRISVYPVNSEDDFYQVTNVLKDNYKDIIYSTNDPSLIIRLLDERKEKVSERQL